jgi:hypothetical protein
MTMCVCINAIFEHLYNVNVISSVKLFKVFTITVPIKSSIDHITFSCETYGNKAFLDMKIPPFL